MLTVFATVNVKRIKLKDKRKRGDCESTIYAFVKKNAQTSRVRYNRYLSSGANRDRTGDLRLAKPALSQLSYGPKEKQRCETRRSRDKKTTLILL